MKSLGESVRGWLFLGPSLMPNYDEIKKRFVELRWLIANGWHKWPPVWLGKILMVCALCIRSIPNTPKCAEYFLMGQRLFKSSGKLWDSVVVEVHMTSGGLGGLVEKPETIAHEVG